MKYHHPSSNTLFYVVKGDYFKMISSEKLDPLEEKQTTKVMQIADLV